MSGPITALYAGLAALLLLVLSVNVIRLRWRYRTGLGDGGHPELARAQRVQGNFVEYAPMVLVLMFLVERAGFSPWVVHALGIMLVLGRAAHAWGLQQSDGPSLGRAAGMALTFTAMSAGAVLALYSYVVS